MFYGLTTTVCDDQGELIVTGTELVVYPEALVVSVYVPAVNPWNNTCPGGVHAVLNVKATSERSGVFVAEAVLSNA